MAKFFELTYNWVWCLLRPFLAWNPRLKDGYRARLFRDRPSGRADIWIQAASAGEAYLALALLQNFPSDRTMSILVSTNTRQGMEVLEAGRKETAAREAFSSVELMFFPFDQPSIMAAAVRHIDPGVMVLLETELWPGLLASLRTRHCPVLLVNARMSPKSLKGYRLVRNFWKALAPDCILAISAADAERFATLFGREPVELMSNIKFDRIRFDEPENEGTHCIRQLLPPDARCLVLGSVREEEEPEIARMIALLLERFPDLIIALFPRHMHRLHAWQALFEKTGKNWMLRSALNSFPAGSGRIVLWDTFGELTAAYGSATAVFVGGSLAPLGGQNFLEPLMYGVVPVIGPSWENFAWVGEELFSAGLVRKTSNWKTAAAELAGLLAAPPDRPKIREAAREYVNNRQGGTAQACQRIMDCLPAVGKEQK